MSDGPDDAPADGSGALDEVVVTAGGGSPSWPRIVAPLVVVALAVGGVAFVLRPGDDDRVRTADAAPSAPATELADDPLFRPTDDVVADLPAVSDAGADEPTAVVTELAGSAAPADSSDDEAGSTDAAPSTGAESSAPLPSQPAQPIAPPADPNGFEDQIQLGRMSIPSLGVDEPLLEGIRLTTLDNGPGHWPGTAMPGQVGNVVVAGHRTSHGAVFRDIDRLVPGDVVNFTVDGEVLEYHVTGTEIVEPDAIWIVDPTSTPTATLFACHPPGSTRQRIVVFLELAA